MTDNPVPQADALVYVVDQVGGTYVLPDLATATTHYQEEKRGGAERLRCGTLRVPRDGMTWDELVEYAIRKDPDRLHLFRHAGDDEFPWHWSHDDESLDYGSVETFALAIDCVTNSAERGYLP